MPKLQVFTGKEWIEIGKNGKTPIAGVDFPIPKDGKDVNVDEVATLVLKQIPEKTYTIEDIEGLKEELLALRSRRAGGHGGDDLEEIPTGTINGTNAVFTLSFSPSLARRIHVYKDGSLQSTLTGDYTLSGSTITFTIAPQNTVIVRHRVP